MYFFLFFLLLILSFLEFFLYQYKLLKIVSFIIVGFVFFSLLAFNIESPDLENYQLHYANLDSDYVKISIEPLIYFLMSFCNDMGLSFAHYQILLASLVIPLFLYSIYKYSPLPIFVLLNFYFIPFFPDIVQIRFFLGFSIFLYSLQFFNNKKWLFFILLIFAVLCHYSLILLFFFLMIKNFNWFKSQIKSNIIILSGIVFLLFIPRSIIDPWIILFNPKYLVYTDKEIGTFIGTIALFLPFFLLNNIIIYFHSKVNIVNVTKINTKFLPIFIDLVRFANYTVLFQYFIRDFSRITQNIHLILIIYLSIIIYLFKEKIIKLKMPIITLPIIIFFYTIFIFYVEFLMVNNFQYFEVIENTFSGNSLFQNLLNIF
jgi:hypothetical protein